MGSRRGQGPCAEWPICMGGPKGGNTLLVQLGGSLVFAGPGFPCAHVDGPFTQGALPPFAPFPDMQSRFRPEATVLPESVEEAEGGAVVADDAVQDTRIQTPLSKAVRMWHAALPPEALLELRQSLAALTDVPFKIGTACSGSDVLLIVFHELAKFWSETLGVPFTFRHCFACEKQTPVQAFLLQNFPDLEVLVPDLQFLADETVPCIHRDGSTGFAQLPKVELFAAGFVCKSRSKLNSKAAEHRGCVQRGTDLTGESFAATGAYIRAHRPSLVFLENVGALAEKDPETGVSDAEWIVEWFSQHDYDCVMVKCDAWTYGSLPRRERLYWIAVEDKRKARLGKVREVMTSAPSLAR